MSIFLKQSKFKNGKNYLSIIYAYKVDGKVIQQTIRKIGFEDDLKDSYEDVVTHFKQVAKKLNEEALDGRYTNLRLDLNETAQKSDDDIKNLGYSALKLVYDEIKINDFLKSKQASTKLHYKLNDVLSLLVFSRILNPNSKYKTVLENPFFQDYNVSYKNMMQSLIKFNKFKDELQFHIWENTAELYKRDTSKTYYDCTNYYFEIEYNDEDILDKDGQIIKHGLRKRGVEKNKRPDPIVELGLLMDASGIPIAYNLFPGNQSEKNTLVPEINKLKNHYNLGRTIVVADRGLNTSDNIIKIAGTSLEKSQKMNGYVYGQSVRGADLEFKAWVLKGNYITDIINDDDQDITFVHKSRVYPKSMYVTRDDLPTTKSGNKKRQSIFIDQKQMVYYSQKYANKQKKDRDMMISKANDLILNPTSYTKATTYGAAAYVCNLTFNKSTGEIADGTNLSLNKRRILEEEQFDGYYSIVTSEENLSDLEIRNIYKGLTKIEETFKVTKSNLKTRPVFVWKQEHIEAHFLSCFVSLVIIRLLEKKLNHKYSINTILSALKKYKCTHVFGNIYKCYNYSDLIEDVGKIYNKDFSKVLKTRKDLRKLLNY